MLDMVKCKSCKEWVMFSRYVWQEPFCKHCGEYIQHMLEVYRGGVPCSVHYPNDGMNCERQIFVDGERVAWPFYADTDNGIVLAHSLDESGVPRTTLPTRKLIGKVEVMKDSLGQQ